MTEATRGKLNVDDPWRQNQKTRGLDDVTITAT
jgi:hypothetical protein